MMNFISFFKNQNAQNKSFSELQSENVDFLNYTEEHKT